MPGAGNSLSPAAARSLHSPLIQTEAGSGTKARASSPCGGLPAQTCLFLRQQAFFQAFQSQAGQSSYNWLSN